jgi:glucose/arabinose dehydrogenase
MTRISRPILLFAAIAALLVACGTATAPSPSASDTPASQAPASQAPASQAPSEPAATPEPTNQGAEVPSGTLTVADGAAVDGPGAPLTDVLASGDLTQPVFVSGVLFLDEDGTVWMADEVVDASVPTFSDVRVQVANYPTDGPTWDMASADITGLQEVNGIRFYEDTRLYGTITP